MDQELARRLRRTATVEERERIVIENLRRKEVTAMGEQHKYPAVEVIMPWLHERYSDCVEWDSADELMKRLHDAGYKIVPLDNGEIGVEK